MTEYKPVAEDFSSIAKALKEIEAEKTKQFSQTETETQTSLCFVCNGTKFINRGYPPTPCEACTGKEKEEKWDNCYDGICFKTTTHVP
jgi:hypothetical protein